MEFKIMTRKINDLIVLSIFLLISCNNSQRENRTINGTWKSIGFGKILKIEGGNYSFYDITNISCLSASQGEIADFGDAIELQNDTLSISSGTSIYKYLKLSLLPNLCDQILSESKKTDPSFNFEVFAKTVDENYPYFELNNIDWDSLYSITKNKITPRTTEVDLYLILDDMLNTLNDNHGYIEPTDEVYEQAEKLRVDFQENQEAEQLEEYGDFQIAELVSMTFLEEDMTKDSWLIQWGKLKENIGYIQVKAMWLFADLNLYDSLVQKNGFVDTYADAMIKQTESEYIQAEVKGVSRIMDIVMNDLKSTDYIILDVRFNGGGQDAVSLEILRRFNNKRNQVATKRARFENGFTKKTPIFIAASETAYMKPVYLLTSQQSASATDFMALASLEIKSIKRIGSHTNGALSDALEKRLPNGWYFSISNLVYEDNNRKCYENIGIPVDFELNYPNDRQTFFRSVANDLEQDKKDILKVIDELKTE